MSIYDRNVETESRPAGCGTVGLPDDPSLEIELAQPFPDDFPSPDEEAEMYTQYMARRFASPACPAGYVDTACTDCGSLIFVPAGAEPVCTACQRRPTPPAGAMFPEVVTWSDDHLMVAIDLCERRDPGLNLHAVGNLPDRHEQFLHACSAELVRRLEARGVKFAA